MIRLFCYLTGGHRYEDTNLVVTEDYRTEKAQFHNYCVKCKKPYCYELPIDLLFSAYSDVSVYKRLKLACCVKKDGEQNELE